MEQKIRRPQIAVIGSSYPEQDLILLANEVGGMIAERGAVLICGGLGGVMEGAARGAKEKGGLTIGIVPGYNSGEANPFIDIVVTTGLGHARNILVVSSGNVIVALPGSHGTRSEISIALKLQRPVIGVKAWDNIAGVRRVDSLLDLEAELLPYF